MKKNLNQAVAEVVQTAQSAGRQPRTAFAEMIVEVIEPNHLSLEIFSAFMPTRTLNVGDSLARRVRKGNYAVRTMVP